MAVNQVYSAFRLGELVVSIRFDAELAWCDTSSGPQEVGLLKRIGLWVGELEELVDNLAGGAEPMATYGGWNELVDFAGVLRVFWEQYPGKWNDLDRAKRAEILENIALEPEFQWDARKRLLKSCPTGQPAWLAVEIGFKAACSSLAAR